MKTKLILATGLLTLSSITLADHNSLMGEGWANMPNDVHNTRIETREDDDNEAFRDFVQYGDGASTVNRFLDDTEISDTGLADTSESDSGNGGSGGNGGNGGSGGKGGRS